MRKCVRVVSEGFRGFEMGMIAHLLAHTLRRVVTGQIGDASQITAAFVLISLGTNLFYERRSVPMVLGCILGAASTVMFDLALQKLAAEVAEGRLQPPFVPSRPRF